MYKLQKVKGEGVKTIIETTRPNRVKAKNKFYAISRKEIFFWC